MRSGPAFLLIFTIAAAQTPAPSFAALSREAERARDAKQLPKAVDLYRQALKLQPSWDEGWWNLGSIEYDLDHYDRCAPAFRKLAALKPDSAPAWTMAGLCEYKLHRYDAALESFERVEKLGFEEPAELSRAARLHLALVLTKAGFFEKAVTEITELTRVDHKSPETIVAAGIAGLRRPWLPFEVPEADRDLVMKLGDAMTSAMEMDHKAAAEKFAAVLHDYPNEPNVHFRFGAYLNFQDNDRGVDEIEKAVALAPDHVPALVALSTIFLKREDLDSALKYAERAVKAGPDDFSTHLALGRTLLARDENERAAGELETAIKLAPAVPDAHFSLASAYSRLGRKADSAREQAEFKRLQRPAAK